MSQLSENQRKKLEEILLSTQKTFGGESATVISIENKPKATVQWIDVDSPDIKNLLGKGLPRRRSIEIFGPESSGKTSLACYLCGQVQKNLPDSIVGYIDMENAIDPVYAKTFGFDVENALLSQPSSGEEALNILESWVEKNVSLVVVDSVAALVPEAEMNGDMGDSHMGLHARLMSQACRKLNALQSRSDTTIIWINQIRMKIGVVYGNPETTTGGHALKFYSTIRLEVRKKEFMEAGGAVVGLRTRVKSLKNKVSAPMKTILVEIEYGKGIQADAAWMKYAILYDVISKAGAGWMTLPSGEKVQGMKALLDLARHNPTFYDEIVAKTKEQMETNPNLMYSAKTETDGSD